MEWTLSADLSWNLFSESLVLKNSYGNQFSEGTCFEFKTNQKFFLYQDTEQLLCCFYLTTYFFLRDLFSRNGRSDMEIETIPPEAELSTQTRRNPASQRPVPIDVSSVGWRGSLFCFVSVSCLHSTGCESSFKYFPFCLRWFADSVHFCGSGPPCHLRHWEELCVSFHLQLVGIGDSGYSSDQVLGLTGYIMIGIRVAVVNKETS